MYIYQTFIYKTADLNDFDSVGSAALKVDSLEVAETAFRLDKTYAEFKALLTGGVTWSNVKWAGGDSHKRLYIVTSSAL